MVYVPKLSFLEVSWHDVGIRCVCLWGAPVKGSFCLFWLETHTKGLCVRSLKRPEENEGRKVPKAVSRREQDTVGRREQSRVGQSRDESRTEWRPVNRSQKGGYWNLLTQASLNTRKWVSIPSGFVGISLELDFPPSSRLCILYVGKEMWNTPGQRWENH